MPAAKRRAPMPNRLPELVHYLIWRCDPADLGATKLNKICWYSDLDAYRTLGRTITGATEYIRLQFGPTPKGVHNVIDQLFQKGRIAVSKENFYGRPKTGEAGYRSIFVRGNRDRGRDRRNHLLKTF
ncbi:MAG TPA: type II toxin-antitoxin system antitoxin SocA domain-containing protein, partial [Bradyrhizobium sp.]|nr:type II toxin-antitoxin system antitoxin SocA domain-containing protein [Bradyrhizobium sp.]